jgi:hypothetical protein
MPLQIGEGEDIRGARGGRPDPQVCPLLECDDADCPHLSRDGTCRRYSDASKCLRDYSSGE